MKIVQGAMTTPKNKIFTEILVGEMTFWWGGNKNLVWRKSTFSGWGDKQILGWWGNCPQ